jgi:prepilin-type N-terminal cleavage/methylation domain-containing protein
MQERNPVNPANPVNPVYELRLGTAMRVIAMSASHARIAPKNRRTGRHGFTLIELMIVIALTAILLTLVFKPLIDSFNLTSRAATQIDTQVNARGVLREMTNLLSNAVFVYDNMQTPINLWFPTQGGATETGTPNPEQGIVRARFAMVEYVLPARQLDQRPGGTPLDPTTQQPIYGSGNTPGQRGYALPLAPGRALGRVFIGLIRNNSINDSHLPDLNYPEDTPQNGMPLVPYGNRFEDGALGSARDNRYTIWKAEVLAYILNPEDANNPNARYVPNLKLFHTYRPGGDPNNPNDITNDRGHPLRLHDPNFFYDNSVAGDPSFNQGNPQYWAVPGWRDLNNDGRVQIWENWRAVSDSLMPLNRVDMVALERDEVSNAITFYDAQGNPTQADDGRPLARLLATFSPGFVENDLGAATALNNTGNESPNPAPTLFKSQYTHWATPFRVLVYRTSDQNPDASPLTRNPLEVYVSDGMTGKIAQGMLAPNAPPPDPSVASDVGPGLDATGRFTNPNATFAFTVDPLRGTVNFAFPSSAILRDANNNPVPARFSPVEVNESYFNDYPNGERARKRHLDLRFLPQTTWNGNPLNAIALSPLAPTRPWYSSVRIVPGSERVIGPDQNPGPNYGYPVMYRRVSSMAGGEVGKNEYKINYENGLNADASDPLDPRVRLGFIEFNSVTDGSSSDDEKNYNWHEVFTVPNNEVRNVEDPAGALNQGRKYRPNGIPNLRVNRQTGQNEYVDPIEVTFSFQMNRPKDVVKVDYMTREIMTVAVEARLYDARTNAPQSTSLTQKVRVRNLQR